MPNEQTQNHLLGSHPQYVSGRLSWLLGTLRRETSSGRFIPQLDGLRFFAIMAVLFYHLNAVVPFLRPELRETDSLVRSLLAQGYIGVQLFFVISGFVLALPFKERRRHAVSPVSLRHYYLRRITRLEPPYLINLIAMWIAKTVIKGVDPLTQLPHLLASLFYVHYLLYGTPSTINAVAWSLEIEVHFYLVMPLLAFVFAVRQAITRRGILLVGIVSSSVIQATLGPLTNHALTLADQLHYFLTGFLLTDIFVDEWQKPSKTPPLWDFAGAVAWITIPCAMVSAPRAAHLVVPAAIFIAYAATLRGRFWRELMTNQFVFTIGGMCYTIYLYNNQIMTSVGSAITHVIPHSRSYNFVLACFGAVIIPIVLILSGLLFLLVEKPFMRRSWPGMVVEFIHRHLTKIIGSQRFEKTASVRFYKRL